MLSCNTHNWLQLVCVDIVCCQDLTLATGSWTTNAWWWPVSSTVVVYGQVLVASTVKIGHLVMSSLVIVCCVVEAEVVAV